MDPHPLISHTVEFAFASVCTLRVSFFGLRLEVPYRYTRSVLWWRHQMKLFSALLAFSAGNSPLNSPHKGQWLGALILSLIFAWTSGLVDNRDAGDLRRHGALYDVTVIILNFKILVMDIDIVWYIHSSYCVSTMWVNIFKVIKDNM